MYWGENTSQEGNTAAVLKGFFGTGKGFFHIPNYNEKGFIEKLKLVVVYTVVLKYNQAYST